MLHLSHQNLDSEDCDLDLYLPLSLAFIHFILQRKFFISYPLLLEKKILPVLSRSFIMVHCLVEPLHHDTIRDESVSKVFIVNLWNKVSKHLHICVHTFVI